MADNNVSAHLAPGETTLGTRIPLTALGQEVPYPHKLTASGDLLSGRGGGARVVINDSGGALLPGRGIRWKEGYYQTRIGGYTGAGEPAEGYIDHMLPAAGVPDDDACLVITKPGTPVYACSDGAAVLADGDYVKTAADGKVTKDAATPTTNGKAGKVESATVTNVDGTRFWMEFNPH
jgi:hypothetical protein